MQTLTRGIWLWMNKAGCCTTILVGNGSVLLTVYLKLYRNGFRGLEWLCATVLFLANYHFR